MFAKNLPTFSANARQGFVSILTLLILPIMMSLITLITQLIFIIETRNEFRFKCLSRSLEILQESDSEPSIEAKSHELSSELKNINTLSEYQTESIFETETNPNLKFSLAYKMKYRWISDFTMICGAQKTLIGEEWKYAQKYSIIEGKF